MNLVLKSIKMEWKAKREIDQYEHGTYLSIMELKPIRFCLFCM